MVAEKLVWAGSPVVSVFVIVIGGDDSVKVRVLVIIGTIPPMICPCELELVTVTVLFLVAVSLLTTVL